MTHGIGHVFGAAARLPASWPVAPSLNALTGLVHDVAYGEWGLASAVFDQEREYRYRLSRTWDPSSRRLLWVLLNPSRADARDTDPTLRRVLTFSRRWGFGSVDVVNLFALRATTPSTLLAADDPIGPLNDAIIRDAVATADRVLVGWGNRGSFADRAKSIEGLLDGSDKPLLALRITKAGQPMHPLYVHAERRPAPWSQLKRSAGH